MFVPLPVLILCVVLVAGLGGGMAWMRTAATNARRNEAAALAASNEQIERRRLMQFEIDLLKLFRRDDPQRRTQVFLKLIAAASPSKWACLVSESRDPIAEVGSRPHGRVRELTFAGGVLHAEQFGPVGLDEKQSQRLIRETLDALHPVAVSRTPESFAEIRCDLQAAVANPDNMAASLPRYLERLRDTLGASRVAIHIRDGESSRCVAASSQPCDDIAHAERKLLADEAIETGRLVRLSNNEHSPAVLTVLADRPFTLAPDQQRLLTWSTEHLGGVLKQTAGRLALLRDARADRLTGLANRRWFDAQLHAALASARSNGGEVSLILVDIDHFKSVNDTFGHLAGDQALAEVAAALRQAASGRREEDEILLARYGGEELAVLMPSLPNAAAQRLAESIRQEVESLSVTYRDRVIPLTVSAGFATVANVTAEAEVLIDAADTALYRAKQTGRNRVCGGRPPRTAALAGV